MMIELFRRMWVGWQGVARGILAAQNVVLMGIAYWIGIGPVAVALRLTGRRLLDHAPADPAAASHWQPRSGVPITMKDASRPF